jgi:hypothetical protein
VLIRELDLGYGRCWFELVVGTVRRTAQIEIRRMEGVDGVKARIRSAFVDIWRRSSFIVSLMTQKYAAIARAEAEALRAQATPVERKHSDMQVDREKVKELFRLNVSRLEREGCVVHDDDDAFSPKRRAAMRKRFVFAGMCFVYAQLLGVEEFLFAERPVFPDDPVMDAFINVVNAKRIQTVDEVVEFTVDSSPTCLEIKLMPLSGTKTQASTNTGT